MKEAFELSVIAEQKGLLQTQDALALAKIVMQKSIVLPVLLELSKEGPCSDKAFSVAILKEALPIAIQKEVLTEEEAKEKMLHAKGEKTKKSMQMSLFDKVAPLISDTFLCTSTMYGDCPNTMINISKANLGCNLMDSDISLN